jgi:hypothetical protein
MKEKKNKLTLNREALRRLSAGDMKEAEGAFGCTNLYYCGISVKFYCGTKLNCSCTCNNTCRGCY